MTNLKKVFVTHILDRTPKKEIPKIVSQEFNRDYKMYLYTLTTPELGDLILDRRR